VACLFRTPRRPARPSVAPFLTNKKYEGARL
jgi:hypothetical protein